MNEYGVVIAPATVQFERLLPGPIERVWSYLIESEKRRLWLASGVIEEHVGGKVVHVWRNNELTKDDTTPPAGYEDGGKEHRMEGQVTAYDEPYLLAYTWQMCSGEGEASEVRYELTPQGDEVLLKLTHSRLPDTKAVLSVSGGWHSHLDVLEAHLNEREPSGFWKNFTRLNREYSHRIGIATPPSM
ncbi:MULTISPECIES: SRPBCC family protein [Dyella]|uniref:SRPBCC family protein n=2 Tax=Dyella TaxID=231454 RepID=A0A4R0YT48_9GAMM|nr:MULTISPECIES: SRPBCC family protein [Dyella]TBR39884.1 SRPBCC family protein [Dyella terrae]TCI12535.1 SRPBCC family protein [Dyella soli]